MHWNELSFFLAKATVFSKVKHEKQMDKILQAQNSFEGIFEGHLATGYFVFENETKWAKYRQTKCAPKINIIHLHFVHLDFTKYPMVKCPITNEKFFHHSL